MGIQRLTVAALQTALAVAADGQFGQRSRAALLAKFTNRSAPPLTDADYLAVAERWHVPVAHIKGVRKVEAPRGAYDGEGRPSIIYERHKFGENTAPAGRFNASHPDLSGAPYGAGGYGPFSAQYQRLAAACALDPEAAFRACSWGAFQVLGENAVVLGYASAFDFALTFVTGEAAHLESFVRFVEHGSLVDKFRACRPGDPVSCRPFVKAYNGVGYHQFNYDVKLAEAIR